MRSVMTCPDCGAQVVDAADLLVGRRVHRLSVSDARVALDCANTVTPCHCANCDIVIGVS